MQERNGLHFHACAEFPRLFHNPTAVLGIGLPSESFVRDDACDNPSDLVESSSLDRFFDSFMNNNNCACAAIGNGRSILWFISTWVWRCVATPTTPCTDLLKDLTRWKLYGRLQCHTSNWHGWLRAARKKFNINTYMPLLNLQCSQWSSSQCGPRMVSFVHSSK